MKSQTIRINGKDIKIPLGLKTSELEDYVDLDTTHFFAEQNLANQSSAILDRNSNLPQKSDLTLITLPRYVQGFDSRAARLQKEITIISHRFPILFDENNLSYISVTNFPLNSQFNFSSTTLLLKIPVQYPYTPPEHFYLKKGLLYNGKSPVHYFQSAGFNDLSDLGWSKYCLHTKSWKPTSDILSGDSLITFLELIKLVFDNLEREEV
jgi:hypothetical protein